MASRLLAIMSLSFAVAAGGCGSDGPTTIPIRGEVIFNGEPLRDVARGIVRYSPHDAGTPAREASGRIQPDGSFEMTTSKKGDGVVPGVYDITVSAYSGTSLSREQVEAGDRASGPKLLIPSKYLEPGSSGLSDTVDSDHSGFKRIELNE